jgi:hypothetical protein
MGARFGSRRAKHSLVSETERDLNQYTNDHQGILSARLRKLPQSTQDSATDTFFTSWYLSYADLSPTLDNTSDLVTSVKDDTMLPSPSVSPTSRRWTLPRTVSLPSIPHRVALSAKNPPDGTSYLSHLLRRHREGSALTSRSISNSPVQNVPP